MQADWAQGALAIVPYVAKEMLPLVAQESGTEDCNVLRTVSYELVFLVSSSLRKTSYGMKFLWN